MSDHVNMLKVLAYLVAEPDASESDMAVAISMALES